MAKERSIENFIPYNIEVLVTVPEEHQTDKGIIIPDGVDAGTLAALNKVVKKGAKCSFVEVGDEVLINSGRPMVVKFKEGTFALIRENQLAGVIRND